MGDADTPDSDDPTANPIVSPITSAAIATPDQTNHRRLAAGLMECSVTALGRRAELATAGGVCSRGGAEAESAPGRGGGAAPAEPGRGGGELIGQMPVSISASALPPEGASATAAVDVPAVRSHR